MKKIVDMDEWNEFFAQHTDDCGDYDQYEVGWEDAFDYISDWLKSQTDAEEKHGRWKLLDNCSNAGVYCSACHKKVYRKDYANQKMKSPYCPNCGTKMYLGEEE